MHLFMMHTVWLLPMYHKEVFLKENRIRFPNAK